jgi:hypothetical protein
MGEETNHFEAFFSKEDPRAFYYMYGKLDTFLLQKKLDNFIALPCGIMISNNRFMKSCMWFDFEVSRGMLFQCAHGDCMKSELAISFILGLDEGSEQVWEGCQMYYVPYTCLTLAKHKHFILHAMFFSWTHYIYPTFAALHWPSLTSPLFILIVPFP